MSDHADIRPALACARAAGAREIALLHCVSAYPVPAGHENLGAISDLRACHRVPVGLSDHGTDPLTPALVVALGASLLEKHFVLEGDDEAIDGPVSATPASLADIVRLAERARRLLGGGVKRCEPAEAGNLVASRRGVYAARPLAPGDTLQESDLLFLRPANGCDPRGWRRLIGQRVQVAVGRGGSLEAALGLAGPVGSAA
jgi:sialic acid synthase SpsE